MPRTAHASPAVEPWPPERATAAGEWRAACDRCGAAYTLGGWLRLAMVARVDSAWLATHVVGWRAEHLIEVRTCTRCLTAMSRRRPAEP
jgi:hypothetical protein